MSDIRQAKVRFTRIFCEVGRRERPSHWDETADARTAETVEGFSDEKVLLTLNFSDDELARMVLEQMPNSLRVS